jgi:hypothetical protein
MVTPVFSAVVDDQGKLSLYHPDIFKREVKRLAGKRVDVTVKQHRETRSSQANRYYFGVVIKLIAEHCGYEPDEMHEVLAFRFLRIEDDPITGSPRRKRTPKTNTKEFADYVDQCIRFGAELGVVIPLPHEVEAS